MNRSLIIAEAGVNHNGSLDLAIELVDAAADAGADIVKFQTFRADKLAAAAAPKAQYQTATTGSDESQFEMLRRLELSREAHHTLLAQCRERGIEFLSSPFDIESLQFLATDLNLDRIKLGSGELTNAPLLLEVGRSGKAVIISTGMATLADVEEALGALAFGYLQGQGTPSRMAMGASLREPRAWDVLHKKVVILHCTTEYPTPSDQINLRAMRTMREAFGLPVGFSDHTAGSAVSVAAASLGAVFIEKHLTLSRDLPGPDHKASLEPTELAAMIRDIREAEAALGSGIKQPQPCEWGNTTVARKSVVALRDIADGEVLSAENVTVKRPGGGRSPFEFFELLGTVASRSYARDEQI